MRFEDAIGHMEWTQVMQPETILAGETWTKKPYATDWFSTGRLCSAPEAIGSQEAIDECNRRTSAGECFQVDKMPTPKKAGLGV